VAALSPIRSGSNVLDQRRPRTRFGREKGELTMPRPPQGMFRRKDRPGWYVRLYRGGRERLLSVGTDYGAACERVRALKAGIAVTPQSAGTVAAAAARWLESYVKTQRSEKCQKVAAQRVRTYIEPYFGHMLVARVQREDVRSFRLWLQSRTSLSLTSVWHVL